MVTDISHASDILQIFCASIDGTALTETGKIAYQYLGEVGQSRKVPTQRPQTIVIP